MKNLIYSFILIFMLNGCVDLNKPVVPKQVTLIIKGKVYSVPTNCEYGFVDDKQEKIFFETNTFAKCNHGDIFWRKAEFVQTIKAEGITSQYLKIAEKNLFAGCSKPSVRTY